MLILYLYVNSSTAMSGDQKVKVENFTMDEEEEEVKISAEMMASMTVSRPHTQVIFKFYVQGVPKMSLGFC